MDALFGLILLVVFAAVTWCVASEGAWGAALTFLCVLFAGLLTMNFFEPIAAMIEDKAGNFLAPYADVAAFVGLFTILTFLGRLATDQIAPTDLEMDGRLYQAARWVFAAATGYTTMAILLTAVHTAPLPRSFIGFRPEGNNLFEFDAPDRRWLGFVQHVSERVLPSNRIFDGTVYKDVPGTDQQVWPSFAIRYATRRQDLESGAGRKVGGGGSRGSTGGSPAPAAPSAPPSF
ncbi:MAG: CvpA family protein [Planctomycetaceae bacterium]|nr:CvpA family protein [Planctomycetaceae bacterium]